MKWFLWLMILFLAVSTISAQKAAIHATDTINGFFSGDLNIYKKKLYIGKNALVTGNIYINDGSVVNYGVIRCGKISMRQSKNNFTEVFENYNTIDVQVVQLDSLGHLHNHAQMTCSEFYLNDHCSVDNHRFMNCGSIKIAKESALFSMGSVNAENIILRDTNSLFYNYYGKLDVNTMLHLGTGANLVNLNGVCVGEKLINQGLIIGSVNYGSDIQPYITVAGISNNYGTIANMSFCDLSSETGEPDLNYGQLAKLLFCNSLNAICKNYTTDIIERRGRIPVAVYPSPATREINIGGVSISSIKEVKLISVEGKILREDSYVNSIEVAEFPPGVYFLQIKLDRALPVCVKFVKE